MSHNLTMQRLNPDRAESASSADRDQSHRILLVEDDPLLRESVAEYLTCVGLEVTAVDCGLAFYHALAENPFTLAIIDLGLPDIDGLQLLEYVRKNTTMSCIVLTARDSMEARISGYDAGADIYMVKPVDCRELASALNNLIRRNQTENHPVGNLPQTSWLLNRQKSTLVTPSSALISLTLRELDFLLCLTATPEQTVERIDIFTTLGYSGDDFSHRALEALVRRLRRKIETAHGSSPILTRHGSGYVFNAAIQLT